MGGGKITRVAAGSKDLALPTVPHKISTLLACLTDSMEVTKFENLFYLDDQEDKNLPLLPEGYFWYLNHRSWTIRKFYDAPEVVIDFDVYLRDKALAGYNISVNKNLVDTQMQTIKTPKKGVRQSTYGGYTNDDFANQETNLSDTRGHGVAYADSLNGVTKKNEPIFSDQNPRNYSPEKSTKAGGSDYGQSIRNHELEATARRNNGVYREINQFSDVSAQVGCGLFVPDVKHAIRTWPGELSYAAFTQGKNYKLQDGMKAKDVWNENKKPSTEIPRAQALSLSTSTVSSRMLEINFGYILAQQTPTTFIHSDVFSIGHMHMCDNNKKIKIIVAYKMLPDSRFEYTCYEFQKMIYSPVAILLSFGAQCEFIIKEMNDRKYASRFSILANQIEKVNSLVRFVSEYICKHKKSIQLIFNDAKKQSSSLSKKMRADDIAELSENIKEHFMLLRDSFLRAKKSLSEYTYFRNELLKNQVTFLFNNQQTEKETTGLLSDVCHMFQKHDQDRIEEITADMHDAMYHLKSINALLHPPKIPVATHTQVPVLLSAVEAEESTGKCNKLGYTWK